MNPLPGKFPALTTLWERHYNQPKDYDGGLTYGDPSTGWRFIMATLSYSVNYLQARLTDWDNIRYDSTQLIQLLLAEVRAE